MSERAVPTELPEKPTGWTKRLRMHVKLSNGSIFVYDLIDESGKVTGIVSQSTRVGSEFSGAFFLDVDTDHSFASWSELRAAWPDVLRRVASAESAAP